MALEKRPYGSTGEEVTIVGLGGGMQNKYSLADGVATVHRALELGITYFDTSPYYGVGSGRYGTGASQALMGEALDGRPERYLLATKVGHLAAPPRFRSPDALRTQIEESLRLLRRDSVDTLQVHEADWQWWWTDDPPQERRAPIDPDYDFIGAPVMQVLQEAKEDGLCRFIGVTGNTSNNLTQVLRHVDVDVCLPAFNYDVLRRGARLEVMPVARDNNVAVVLGGIFQAGREADVHPEWLTSPPDWMTPDLKDRMERLYTIQRAYDLSLVELTIRYLLADDGISTILVGAASPAEIEESVAAAEKGPLTADLHQALEQLGDQ